MTGPCGEASPVFLAVRLARLSSALRRFSFSRSLLAKVFFCFAIARSLFVDTVGMDNRKFDSTVSYPVIGMGEMPTR